MASNLGVQCCLAVFLFCAVWFQSSGAAEEKEENPFGLFFGILHNLSQPDSAFVPTTTTARPLRQDRLTVEEGWIVIQQRFNGSVNFNRGWQDYVDGFGTPAEGSEFWWGLEWVHQLTADGSYELMIEMKDRKGESRYARYSEFVVGGRNEYYRLKKLAGYSGTAGDVNALDADLVPTGMPFSTHDNFNGPGRNCAWWFRGGWWWNVCGGALNSYWGNDAKWKPWKEEAVAYTRMLIRPRK